MPGPVNPLPPPILALALAAGAAEVVLQAGAAGLVGGPEAVGWRMAAISRLGFFQPVLEAMIVERRLDPAGLLRLVSYPLVHLGALHAIFGTALLLALGQAAARRLGAGGAAAVALGASVAGALAYGLLQDGRAPLVGLYPAVYGLLGAFTQGLWAVASDVRGRLLAFRLAGVLVAMQILFRLGFGVGGAEWLADAGGFVAGFGLAALAAPGAAARLRARLRAR